MTISQRDSYMVSTVASLVRLGSDRDFCRKVGTTMRRLPSRDFMLWTASREPFQFALTLVFQDERDRKPKEDADDAGGLAEPEE